MIYRNSELIGNMHWTPDSNPAAGTVALQFLLGERELLHLAHARSSAIVALTVFLESAADAEVLVDRASSGDIRVSSAATSDTLLLTGKTAEVLRSYLDEEPVSMRDRADMTVRRRIA
ncbi:MAG TPA: hypothetical protein VLV78_05320 [Thermoanaerobaculia bacterium]|nr:hypothetical protein [Thermoanaerobaculia bacterium]